ncbi:hypothetical protein D3C73_997150 [compost metagenome]
MVVFLQRGIPLNRLLQLLLHIPALRNIPACTQHAGNLPLLHHAQRKFHPHIPAVGMENPQLNTPQIRFREAV